MKRTYSNLKSFTDKTNDTFSASDVKELQEANNATQKEIIAVHNNNFERDVLFDFQNSEYNSMIFYKSKNYDNIDRVKSKNIRYDSRKKALTMRRVEDKESLFVFDIFDSKEPILAKRFYLTGDFYCPDGCNIECFISNDGTNFTCIDFAKELVFENLGNVIKLIIKITTNGLKEIPEIYNLGVLFYNEVIQSLYGLKDTDYSPLPTPEYQRNTTYIIRNGSNKVTSILDDFSITKLNRDENQSVNSILVETNDGSKELTTIIKEDVNGTNMVTQIKSEKRKR